MAVNNKDFLYCGHEYDDIIKRDYVGVFRHTHMSMEGRAAQFSPFAALTGYKEAVDETGRYVDRKIELDEGKKEQLDIKLNELIIHIQDKKSVELRVTYFEKDLFKDGGSYNIYNGELKKIDTLYKSFIFEDGKIIEIEDIFEIEICD